MCENLTGIIKYANLRTCTSLYRFLKLHILDKNKSTLKFATARNTAIGVVQNPIHFCHGCSSLQYQSVFKSTDSEVHDPAPTLPHNLSEKHPLVILHPKQTCMRNLMEIRDKRSGSIFQSFDRSNLVWFPFYGPSTHLRSFRARSVTLTTPFLGKPPGQFTST